MDASVDLDAMERALVHALADVEVLAATDATLQLRVEEVPVDLVRYRYPPLEATVQGPQGFPTAHPLDLAVMKLAAIAHRGLYRDFWDLHALMTDGRIPLQEALNAYTRRFRKAQPDLYHVARSLTYFDDAERQSPMPRGLTAEHWATIRQTFEREAPIALQQLVRELWQR